MIMEKPQMEIVEFEAEDIVTASNDCALYGDICTGHSGCAAFTPTPAQ